jgi:hypothetical protein
LQQQFSRTAAELRVHQDQRLIGIPIVQIMRRELEMPFLLACLRIERENGIRVEVVAFTFVSVVVGAGLPVAQ